ncbi:MAG: hypothetical protein IJG07_12015 [Prevotella sp.]|nr:hypothetical protein [Prevotella sp.]
MFSIQRSLFLPTEICTEELFYQLVRDPKVKQCEEEYRATGDAKKKRAQPAFIFQATFGESTSKSGKLGAWRKQETAQLNGLCMLDIDHVENPKELYESWQLPTEVMLVHITPSGKGLRLVFKADAKVGNLADNQHRMAELLGVTMDESCKDASRMSFCVTEEDILFINKEIFDYHDEAFSERYTALYRDGRSQATDKNSLTPAPSPARPLDACYQRDARKGEGSENNEVTLEKDEEGEYCYHGIKFRKICEAWQEAQGGAPVPGDRHRTMLQMALDFRYITDNRPENVVCVLKLCGFVQDVIRERGEEEVRAVADTACERRLYRDIPKRLQAVLESAGVHASKGEPAGRAVAGAEIPYELFAERLEPLLSAPYSDACRGVERHNWLGAVFAAGAMYCTLLSRCWYLHFNGAKQRMNPQVLIIGDPASGKSFAKELDDQIMCSMRAQDEEVRAAETRYKQEQKKRGTSSKAQKQDALVEPEGMIRYLPTKTSNNIFFRRLKRAKEVVDGEVMPMHLYMFDSELDSSISAQSGGAWIGKHDLELKAFHNELSGVDYANSDSINDILPVYWNSVTTGTQISLYKKFTPRNINDGLCSRVAIFPMETARYQMVKKRVVNFQANEALKLWGFKMEQLHGELPLERLTDHVYDLCYLSAQEAEAADDRVLDYLRKRAVFYATWLTIPRIVARQYDEFRKTGKLEVTDDDLKFSTLIYDAVIYFQDHFFGQMLQDSWDNAAREYVPRKRNSKNAEAYRQLPETFGVKEVMATLDIEDGPARQQCKRWVVHGFVERVRQGKYKKIMKEIMA